VLLYVAIALAAFGLVMVYSASAIYAQAQTGDGMYLFKRQLFHGLLGGFALFVGLRFGYQRMVKWAYPLLVFSFLLLVLLLVPGVGGKAGGSVRWIKLAFFNFQPGELVKIAFVVYLAFSLTRKKENIQTFSVGFLPHLMVTGVLMLLLLAQPDFGTAATLAMLLFLMLFLAGTRLSYIVVAALTALPVAYGLIVGSEYRLRRLLAFLDPWSHRFDIGYHITESLMSLGSGGVFGVGLGEGKHKLFFLPAAHTDFIFAQVGEELGLVGAVAVVMAFSLIVWRGMRTAWRAPDLFGTYLAFGLTALIGLQTLINMGVVTGLLPTKGLTLPFVSYGGSSMLCTMFGVGLLLDISAASQNPQAMGDPKVTWP
jgi:cell division protein FtsW